MRCAILLAGVLLTGCASAPPEPVADRDEDYGASELPPSIPVTEAPSTSRRLGRPGGERGQRAGDRENKDRPQDYLPFIDVAIDPEAANNPLNLDAQSLEDSYTRIRIVSRQLADFDTQGVKDGNYEHDNTDRSYKDESRFWLMRMLGSKAVTRVLLTEFDISKPDMKASEALFSSSFVSNTSEGESWETTQKISIYATPWFKVSSDTTLTTNVKMQLADERQSSGASTNVLNSLTTATNLIAPSSQLVTYFTAPALTTASNFLETSVSTLFGRAITETTSGSMAIKTWEANRPIVEISAALPDPDDIRKTKDVDELGGWAVFLDEPRLSMFTNALAYGPSGLNQVPDFTLVAAPDVLNYEISGDLKVYDYIFSRLELSDRLNDLNENGSPDDARQICNRIERGLLEVGFNAWDAAAGVHAAAVGDQFTQLAQNVMMRTDTCEA
ncbi:MAG: hypothetical protein AAGA24_03100, partial [Pseudomonadota bacterium]